MIPINNKNRSILTRKSRNNNNKNKSHKNKIIAQGLWVGPKLSRMEYYSIKSFLNLGFTFHLYVYEKVKNIPKGTIVKDGNVIMPAKEVFDLKSTYLPFSDIWRYKLLHDKGNYWVDLDMIAIKKFDFKEKYVFSSERTIQEGAFRSYSKRVPNIGVLKAPKGSPFYLEAYKKCLEFNKNNKNDDKLKYMKMLRKLIIKHDMDKYVKDPKLFCNLDWWHAREAFEPHKEYKKKYGVVPVPVNKMTQGVYTIHFWRDRVSSKYKMDTNADYDPDSLWEKTLKRVDKTKTRG